MDGYVGVVGFVKLKTNLALLAWLSLTKGLKILRGGVIINLMVI